MSNSGGGITETHRHVAQTRVNHAQQLRSSMFERILKDITDYLKLDPDYLSKSEPLEDFLKINSEGMPDSSDVQRKIDRHLPSFDHAEAVCFKRLKEPERLAAKMVADDRDTYDTYGMQLWLSEPQLLKEIIKLDNPQHPLRKKWKVDGIKFEFDNHYTNPPGHGYRALHLNFSCPGNKNWSENLEIQIMPALMIYPYLMTRKPYEAYRALREHAQQTFGKNETNWPRENRVIVDTLRNYIRALYEAYTYRADLMGLTNKYESTPVHENGQKAWDHAEKLEPAVTYITTVFKGYGEDPAMMMQSARDVIKGLRGDRSKLYAQKFSEDPSSSLHM